MMIDRSGSIFNIEININELNEYAQQTNIMLSGAYYKVY